MSTRTQIRQATGDRIFDVINYFLLGVIFIIMTYPILFIISASFSDPHTVASGQMFLFPKGFTLAGYRKIFAYRDIWIGYRNTIYYTVVQAVISVILTISFAYPLSRPDFKARGILTIMITVTMFFSGGMIPSYLVVKSLNMLDSVWAIILPAAISTWNVIITRTFFQTSIPSELREAASIDGCSNLKFFTKIVIPLSRPIVAVMALYYASGRWNSYFSALIYLTDRSKFPLTLFLRQILILKDLQGSEVISVDPGAFKEQQMLAGVMKYGIIIVSTIPMMVLYPFIQKYFVKGVMIGSIKG